LLFFIFTPFHIENADLYPLLVLHEEQHEKQQGASTEADVDMGAK
jgi:hypothetical protein